MDTDERIDRLERRLGVLEGLVRQLTPLLRGQVPTVEARTSESAATPGTDGPTAGAPAKGTPVQVPLAEPPQSRLFPAPIQPTGPWAHTGATKLGAKGTSPAIDSEQWFGQRGLLAVGVIFLILAAGYLLKLSFDRGWISPFARCLGGALAGVAVGAIGWRLLGKGLRTYGAALIGCGAAIVYLAVWAASKLYQFLPPGNGIAALALVSLALAAIAFAINVEALGATAALGAFFAPLLLGTATSNPNALLFYLGFMGASLGWVSAYRRWRSAMLVVALSYFSLPATGAFDHANTTGVLVYGLFGGCGGLYVGLREGWWETRVLAFVGGWGLLGLANEHMTSHWPTVLGAIILAAPVWWRALRSPAIWPGSGDPRIMTTAWSFGESFYFYLTPLFLGWAIYQLAPADFDRDAGWVPLLVAIPYLVAGYTAERRPFALVGTTAILVAALSQWNDIQATWALLALTTLWALTDHILRRADGRWYGFLSGAAALAHLFWIDIASRGAAEPAFVGPWALTLWWTVGAFGLLAAGLWRRVEGDAKNLAGGLPALFWTLSGLILLSGVTGELQRYFVQSSLPPTTAALSSGLSISAWWIVFAAGLILLGFRRGLKPVRVAGLLVAAMAVLKVVLLDLSTLDALYRVGSVLILGMVSLSLAYLYHKRAKTERSGGP